jgi:hypothetical protein
MPDPKTLEPTTWLPIDQLASQLHCGERTVDELRADGVFRPGTHFYAVGKGQRRGKFVYCLELCRAALLERTAQLEAERKAKVEAAVTYDAGHLDELLQEVRDGD